MEGANEHQRKDFSRIRGCFAILLHLEHLDGAHWKGVAL